MGSACSSLHPEEGNFVISEELAQESEKKLRMELDEKSR
jgi:hypothetical protein